MPEPIRTAWHFDYTFRVDIAHRSTSTHVTFSGDLDALAAKVLQRDAPIPTAAGASVVLDFAALESIDMTGVREIRRIQHVIEAAGGHSHIHGTDDTMQQLLDLIPLAQPAMNKEAS